MSEPTEALTVRVPARVAAWLRAAAASDLRSVSSQAAVLLSQAMQSDAEPARVKRSTARRADPKQVEADPSRAPGQGPTGSSLNEPKTVSDGAAPPNAGLLIAEHLRACPKRPPDAVVGQTAKLVGGLVAEGISEDAIRAGLAMLRAKALNPATLPSLVNEHLNPPSAVLNGARASPGLHNATRRPDSDYQDGAFQ